MGVADLKQKFWHYWFTVNELIRKDSSGLANKNQRRESKTTAEWKARVKVGSQIEVAKANKQTFRQISTILLPSQESEISANSSYSGTMSDAVR